MREILFRGKQLKGKWVFGDLYTEIYNPENDPHGCDRRVEASISTHDKARPWHNVITDVNPDTVGQYIGLTDKNGKKIFEGDIVHCYGHDSIGTFDWKAVVEFGNPNCTYSWGWQLKPITEPNGNPDILLWVEMSDYMDIYCEVIGNIHDNPELLEVSE